MVLNSQKPCADDFLIKKIVIDKGTSIRVALRKMIDLGVFTCDIMDNGNILATVNVGDLLQVVNDGYPSTITLEKMLYSLIFGNLVSLE